MVVIATELRTVKTLGDCMLLVDWVVFLHLVYRRAGSDDALLLYHTVTALQPCKWVRCSAGFVVRDRINGENDAIDCVRPTVRFHSRFQTK